MTDFGSVFTKRREGCIFCAAFFRVLSSGSRDGFAKCMSQILVSIAPAPLPLVQMAHQGRSVSRRQHGGIHILHNRHIASIEPVCTSTDVPSRFFFMVDDVLTDDDVLT